MARPSEWQRSLCKLPGVRRANDADYLWHNSIIWQGKRKMSSWSQFVAHTGYLTPIWHSKESQLVPQLFYQLLVFFNYPLHSSSSVLVHILKVGKMEILWVGWISKIMPSYWLVFQVNILNVGSKIFNREKNPQDLRLRSIIQRGSDEAGWTSWLWILNPPNKRRF